MTTERSRALLCYWAAMLVLLAGGTVAAASFPGGFDWAYSVVSRLGSPSHNPAGAPWLTGALLLCTALLWPVTGYLARGADRTAEARQPRPRISVALLRLGLIGAGALALEGFLDLELAFLGRKGHEMMAIATFLGLYGGVLGLFVHRIRHAAGASWPPLLVMLPLIAVGVSQVALYFDQRDLGWVNVAWRELGVPLWLSFAFWQWLAVTGLAAGIGYLVAERPSCPRPARS